MVPTVPGKTDREFSVLEGVAFLASMIAVQMSSELFAQWGTYFYSPSQGGGRIIYVSIGLVALIFAVGRVFDVISDPLIGIWSDKTHPRPSRTRLLRIRGRRRPFIFWGSILMTGTAIAFWYPPIPAESTANLAYGSAVMSTHWVFYTIAYVPLLALAPEVARSRQARVRLGTWIAAGMTIGLAMAVVLPGVLITHLDPARSSAVNGSGEPAYSPAGYQRVAILFALVALLLFQFFVWTVRERATSAQPPARVSPLAELVQGLRNPVFRLYFVVFAFFYIGYLAVQRVLPYWAELGLGGDEETVTVLAIPFIVTCLASALLAPQITKIVNLKWLVVGSLAIITVVSPLMYVIGRLDASTGTKVLMGMALFASAGVGQGFAYVMMTPLLGEIIDLDAKQSGRRREALYNSMHGVMVKASLILAIVLATGTMRLFGNSADNHTGVLLVGPIGGLFGLAGLVAACYYPILNPVKRRPR